MKFSLASLKDFLRTDASLDEICNALVNIGLEVENVESGCKGLVVCRVDAVEKHPDADNLKLCQVNSGKELLQIVCGAPNVRVGLKTVLATIGTVMPYGDFTIKASKIRGVHSNGMMCSSRELEIGDEHAGVIELGDDYCVGDEFHSSSPIIEVVITPNRGDCLGIYGIARDLAAAGIGHLRDNEELSIESREKSAVSISVKDDSIFIGRYFSGVKNGESPDWLKQKLESVGLNPKSLLVDITNYFSMFHGRPMHVYDADAINGSELVVQELASSQQFKALDGNSYNLEHGDKVICNENGEVASLLGIIGGQDSACTAEVRNIFLEIVCTDYVPILLTRRRIGISTDASYRFERSLDPGFMVAAMNMASKMIVDLAGGSPSDVLVAGEFKANQRFKFNTDVVAKVGGIDIAEDKIFEILKKLGFAFESGDIIIPSWRNDIFNENDLVEEVLRIYGYDKVPIKEWEQKPVNDNEHSNSDRSTLVSHGIIEVITWSFMDSKKSFVEINNEMKLTNPVTECLNVMRPSLVPNLLEIAIKNRNRDYNDIAIFEIGNVYKGFQDSPSVIAGLRLGNSAPRNIYKVDHEYDFFDAKADVMAVLANYGMNSVRLTKSGVPGYYHPGKSASIALGKNPIAFLGVLHPKLTSEVKGEVVIFEIFLDKLPLKKKNKKEKFHYYIYPAVKRDFAFVIDKTIYADQILDIVKKCEFVQSVSLFDLYNINDQQNSIAIGVTLQSQHATLSGDDIKRASDSIISNVESKLDAKLRDQ